MGINRVTMTEEQALDKLNDFYKVKLKSSLPFVSAHRGYRPGKWTLLIGMASGGKSTLRNTIIKDFVTANPDQKVFLVLSEESKSDFEIDVARNSYLGEIFKNVFVFSEIDEIEMFQDRGRALNTFKDFYERFGDGLFVFDNITTSRLYGSQYREQVEFCNLFKGMVSKNNAAAITIAHTGSHIKNYHKGLIDMTDIQGSRDPVKLAEFQYILQTFQSGEDKYTTLRIAKCRHLPVSESFYLLFYDKQTGTYEKAKPISFEIFKEFYHDQNTLDRNKSDSK